MRYISGSYTNRQIQPVDFVFLSEADSDVVKGVEGMLRTMFGFSDNVPIILCGVYVDATYKPNQSGEEERTYKITAGKILSGGMICEFDEIEIIKPSYEYNSLLETVRWMRRETTISPSPVKNADGVENVTCHHFQDSMTNQSKTVKPTSNVGAGLWVLSDMYRLDKIVTYEELWSLEQRVVAIENKLGL